MASVAEQLREAREAQKLTVHQVAEFTKIRSDHIRAVEEGNYDVFVAPVYIRGFVRTYAKLLKLDVPQIMAALDQELSRTEKFSEPPPLAPHPRGPVDFLMLQLSKLDWRKTAVAMGVVAVALIIWGIVAVWRNHRARDPLRDLPPAVYHPNGSSSGDTLPLTNAPTRKP